MNGGLVFCGKLLTHLTFPLESSYMHATRYRNTTSGGELDWKVPPLQDLKDRTVVVVDDILDEGHTLAAIIEHCEKAGAKEVLSCVLIDKKHDRKARLDRRVTSLAWNAQTVTSSVMAWIIRVTGGTRRVFMLLRPLTPSRTFFKAQTHLCAFYLSFLISSRAALCWRCSFFIF